MPSQVWSELGLGSDWIAFEERLERCWDLRNEGVEILRIVELIWEQGVSIDINLKMMVIRYSRQRWLQTMKGMKSMLFGPKSLNLSLLDKREQRETDWLRRRRVMPSVTGFAGGEAAFASLQWMEKGVSAGLLGSDLRWELCGTNVEDGDVGYFRWPRLRR